jgi:hypothetical protein
MPFLPVELGSGELLLLGLARAIVSYNLTELPPFPTRNDIDITQSALSLPGPYFLAITSGWHTTQVAGADFLAITSGWHTIQVAGADSRQRVPSRSIAQQRINNLRATAMIAILRRA